MLERADARDLRRPCADDGRLGGLIGLLGEPKPSGGADGDQGFPPNVASNWYEMSALYARWRGRKE